MQNIFNFIFNNIIFIVFIIIGYYIYHEYKDLKERVSKVYDIYNRTLDKYLREKFKEFRERIDRVANEYGHEGDTQDLVVLEITRLRLILDKTKDGTLNDQVDASNAINKHKLNKKIDLEKFPFVKDLENFELFTQEELDSVDNGLAIARREFNAEVFRYNEKATGFPIQYFVKMLKLPAQFSIFEIKQESNYDDNYEVFEEKEPEINFLSSLNLPEEIDLPKEKETTEETEEENLELEEENTNVYKPSTKLDQDK